MAPRIVIGLGSGRCGTKSLAHLLNLQERAHVEHERHGPVPWHGAEALIADSLKELLALDADLVGDVGFYYLPYVERILSRYPTVRFVCLQRPKRATVASYMKKSKGRNPWMEHDGCEWKHDGWDASFPKSALRLDQDAVRFSPSERKRFALDQYWDEYYDRAQQLQREHPEAFRIVPMTALNSTKGQDEILAFVGVPEGRRTSMSVRLNTRWQETARYWQGKARNALRRF
jgi:hypothetical protein